jgi:hypothetical protein
VAADFFFASKLAPFSRKAGKTKQVKTSAIGTKETSDLLQRFFEKCFLNDLTGKSKNCKQGYSGFE